MGGRYSCMFNKKTRTWVVEPGDTLTTISQAVYTDPARTADIERANRSILQGSTTLQRGWRLYVPSLNRDVGQKVTNVANVDGANYRLTIDDEHIEFIDELQFSSGQAQGIRLMAFSIPGESAPNAKVGSIVTLTVNGALFLDGWLIRPDVTYDKSGGYVVQWQAATKAYPLVHTTFKSTASRPATWNNITLRGLIDAILEGEGVALVIPAGSTGSETFNKIGFEGTESKMEFIINVAQKKGYAVQGLANGDLTLYRTPTGGVSVGDFDETSRMTAQYNYEGLASEYRAISQKSGKGGAGTATNTLLPFTIFKQITNDKGNEGDLTTFAQYTQSREYAAALSLEIEVYDVFSKSGQVWTPGDYITVKSKPLDISEGTSFVIDIPTFEVSKSGTRVKLSCVPPEVRRNELPERLPFL